MKDDKINPIFIVGNWKSGTTLAQFYISESDKVYNIFPDDEDPGDYDGTHFWKRNKCHRMHRKLGNFITDKEFKYIDKESILDDIYTKHNPSYDYSLLKRPQFVLNINLINWLYPNVKMVGVQRDLVSNCYSYLRANTAWSTGHGIKIGLKPPGWTEYNRKSVLEYAVWTYYYSQECMKKHNVPILKYEDFCDDQGYINRQLKDIVGEDLEIPEQDIKNQNDAYKKGTTLVSRNRETCKGDLNIGEPSNRKMRPFTEDEINKIYEYSDKIKDEIEILDEI